jgi:tellurite resistance protein TerC
MMPNNLLFWVLFNAFVLAMLALDLGVFNRNSHRIKFREAIIWSGVWVTLALAFAALIYFRGHLITGETARPNSTLALEFVTGYLIELSLSVDNLFVFLLIFRYFKVPNDYQHKVLFWGIVGALIMRAIFIAVGVSLIRRFHWIIFVFGAILIYSGWKLLFQKEDHVDPSKNPVLKFARRWLRVTHEYVEDKFFVRRTRVSYATPLFLVLLVVETTDVIFAVDSIPAVLAVTNEAFIVYTSNVFAILGLRSLYFALSGFMEIFRFLHYGLAVILIFIGAKMLSSNYIHMPILLALGVVAGVLIVSVGASLIFPKKAGA